VRRKALALLVLTLAVTACGGTTKRNGPLREAIPDVRGMNAADAAVRLIKARYCVRLERGTPPANDVRPTPGSPRRPPRMPIERQSPPAGSTRRPWSMVTLTVGGVSAHAATYIDVWDGGARVPCPAITMSG
jgi:hypothetical protein